MKNILYISLLGIMLGGCSHLTCDDEKIKELVGKNLTKTTVNKTYEEAKNGEFALAFLDEFLSGKLPEELEPLGKIFANARGKNCEDENLLCKFAKSLNKAQRSLGKENIRLSNFKNIGKDEDKLYCQADMRLIDNDGEDLLEDDLVVKYQAWTSNERPRVKILEIKE